MRTPNIIDGCVESLGLGQVSRLACERPLQLAPCLWVIASPRWHLTLTRVFPDYLYLSPSAMPPATQLFKLHAQFSLSYTSKSLLLPYLIFWRLLPDRHIGFDGPDPRYPHRLRDAIMHLRRRSRGKRSYKVARRSVRAL